MYATICDIKKFAIHDGDGIRTTVFLKGCPLNCVWCHNPEMISDKKELGYFEHKCVLCGACSEVCECHKIIDGKHFFDRDKCIACGACVDECTFGALTLYGKEMSIDDICKALLEDREFYITSSGGITISGGECLVQADACREILKRMKDEGIDTAVDTCGAVAWENIQKVIDYTDVFLFDIKAIDDEVHRRCTGASNKVILENIKKIDDYGKKIEVRIPYVPNFNSGEIDKIVEFVSGLKNLVRVRLLAYHDFARSKYMAIGRTDTMPKELPDSKTLEMEREKFRKIGIECIE